MYLQDTHTERLYNMKSELLYLTLWSQF